MGVPSSTYGCSQAGLAAPAAVSRLQSLSGWTEGLLFTDTEQAVDPGPLQGAPGGRAPPISQCLHPLPACGLSIPVAGGVLQVWALGLRCVSLERGRLTSHWPEVVTRPQPAARGWEMRGEQETVNLSLLLPSMASHCPQGQIPT